MELAPFLRHFSIDQQLLQKDYEGKLSKPLGNGHPSGTGTYATWDRSSC